MGNPFIGDVTVEIERITLNLRLDFNALCAFEGEMGADAPARVERLEQGRGSFRELRAMIWAMLRRHHPVYTLQDVGEMIGGGSGDMLSAAMMAAFRAAAPPPQDAEAASAGKPRAAAGTTH